MIQSVALLMLEAWLVCALLQASLWFVAQRTKNAGIVDVGWAQSFTLVVLVFGLQAEAPRSSWLPLATLVIAWSTRLTCYLISRGAATGKEEGRYLDLRKRWALGAAKRFFGFFQAQAALTAMLSIAFVVPFVTTPNDGGVLRVIGFSLGAIGVLGETIADAQLAAWKRDPSKVGKVCDTGLWGWSRHPNYFFEWCFWLGLAVYGIAFAPLGLIALLGAAIIFGSIFWVTGIPPTENQALRSKGDAYRSYQARVSRFIPLPPKRTRPSV